jgi:DNA-binding transcriptional MerR regulator
VAVRFDLTLRTLRFYEQRGLLNPIRHGRTRYYDAEQKLRVQMIVKGKQLGFTLLEIADFMEAEGRSNTVSGAFHLHTATIQTQLRHLVERRNDIDQAIAELQAALGDPNRKTDNRENSK